MTEEFDRKVALKRKRSYLNKLNLPSQALGCLVGYFGVPDIESANIKLLLSSVPCEKNLIHRTNTDK